MLSEKDIELFCLKSALIEQTVQKMTAEYFPEHAINSHSKASQLGVHIEQFDASLRLRALEMAEHYKIFYMLENDIRRLIQETLEANHGQDWWEKRVPDPVKKEVNDNRTREEKAAITRRSNALMDYTNFGQLGDIIRANWEDFAGMLSNQNALGRVLFQLNLSRGAIAHCGMLEQDEVDRLYLTIKDWFRVTAGPSSSRL